MHIKSWKYFIVVLILIVALIFLRLPARLATTEVQTPDLAAATEVQAPDIEWERLYGGSDLDRAHAIQQTKDGGYIVAGGSTSNDGDLTMNNGSYDAWIIKLDPKGDIVWQKTFGGSRHDIAISIQQTADGGYVVVGYSVSDDGDFSQLIQLSPELQYTGYGWVFKLDNSGEIEWRKAYGDSSIFDVQQTTDGGYIFINTKFAVVKLDSKGAIEWEGVITGSGEGGLKGYTVRQTKDGGYIVAGCTDYPSDDVIFLRQTKDGGYVVEDNPDYIPDYQAGDVRIARGGPDFLIIKLAPEGDIVWQKTFGGSGAEYAFSIQQTTDGGYIVGGDSNSDDGDVSVNSDNTSQIYWIVKLDAEGNLLWQRALGRKGERDGRYPSAQQTNDGGYIIAGFSSTVGDNRTYWIVKLKADGDIDWEKSLGHAAEDIMFRTPMQQAADGGYVIAGTALVPDRKTDIWIVKLQPEL